MSAVVLADKDRGSALPQHIMSKVIAENSAIPSTARNSTTLTSKRNGRAWVTNGIFVVYTHIVVFFTLIFLKPSINILLLTLTTWFASGIGITMGYHRLWSHRTYHATFPLRFILAAFGTLGFQGSIKWWAERHRLHHRFTDTEHDPYNAKRGFWHCHIGWIFKKQYYPKLPSIDISDLLRDPIVEFQHRYYVPLAIVLGFLLPSLLSWWWWNDTLGGLLYGGHVAKVFSWHTTFCINSFAHWLGSQDYSLQFTARGNLLLALLTNGEGHHNFHHEFPRDYRNGIKWYDYDPTKWLIKICECIGLASELVRTQDQDIKKALVLTAEQKLAAARSELDWGPEISKLPRITRKNVEKRIADGETLLIVDGFVYDVSTYASEHPGGARLLKTYAGRDATLAFNGGLNNHTQAARTKARSLIIAVLAE